MMNILIITLLYLVVHSYFVYPLILRICSGMQTEIKHNFNLPDLPPISVLIAARNEEDVLDEKLKSVFSSHYPKDKIEVIVGSDASTDATDNLVEKWIEEAHPIRLLRFDERQGKSAMLNHLSKAAKHDWLICTDANVIHHPDAFRLLMQKAILEKADLVGAEIRYVNDVTKVVAQDEDRFLRFENAIKERESNCWQLVMGVEGGCYLIRKSKIPIIPNNALVDDFYVSMHVLEMGSKVLWEHTALAFEDVSLQESEEYRRKVRISRGNFQNLKRFAPLLWKKSFPLGFAFLSHKVLRWFSPLFLLIALGLLMIKFFPYPYLFYGLLSFLVLLSLLIIGPSKKWPLLRSIRHLTLMNIALLEGLILHITKRGENVWEPTKRKQQTNG